MSQQIRDLELAIQGNASRLESLKRLSEVELHCAWQQSSQPKVTKAAVLSVLVALRDGRITPDQASHWAVFVRGGYIPAPRQYRPIDIEYEPRDHDAIAEAVMRLEGVNDEIDGPLEPDEYDQLIESLQPSGPTTQH